MNTKIKNLQAAAERIKLAVKNQEKIILYGDSDCDGICSTVILEEAIKNLGGTVDSVMFPNREEDGYGLNLKALDVIKGKNPALFITLDLGIGNVKEIALAKEMGFEVIVVDHHVVLKELPPADIIVDIQQSDDPYPFKELCNAGITFKLAKEMLGPDISKALENNLSELAALATISDMVPQIGENKDITQQGLQSIQNTFRPGLKAFLNIVGKGEIASGDFRLISAINASESIDFNNESYQLLTSTDPRICQDMAEMLLAKVRLKQQKIKHIAQEVERRISKDRDATIIFEGDPAWKLTLAGPVASIIASKYKKPTFIYRRMDGQSAGSVRSLVEGQNSVDAMKTCADILVTYGGHPKASGFRCKNENLEAFKERLTKHFNSL